MAVMAAQTSSDLTRVPEPPSIRMPVRALPVAALFSSTVPVLGTAEPPEAEAPDDQRAAVDVVAVDPVVLGTSPRSTVFWVVAVDLEAVAAVAHGRAGRHL